MKIDEQPSLAGVQQDITRLSARWPERYRFLVLTRRDEPRRYELYLKHRLPLSGIGPTGAPDR